MKKLFIIFIVTLISMNSWGHGVSKQAKTYIISPVNGETVTSPFIVKFGIKGFLIAPAGKNKHKAGHYHLIIDRNTDLPLDEAIPYDAKHRHYDMGETEVLLDLSPGQHSLQLVVADEEHEPFEQLVSDKITIEVLK